jgi:hypothetical protein
VHVVSPWLELDLPISALQDLVGLPVEMYLVQAVCVSVGMAAADSVACAGYRKCTGALGGADKACPAADIYLVQFVGSLGCQWGLLLSVTTVYVSSCVVL